MLARRGRGDNSRDGREGQTCARGEREIGTNLCEGRGTNLREGGEGERDRFARGESDKFVSGGRGREGQICARGERDEQIQTNKQTKQIKSTNIQTNVNKQTARRDNSTPRRRGHRGKKRQRHDKNRHGIWNLHDTCKRKGKGKMV